MIQNDKIILNIYNLNSEFCRMNTDAKDVFWFWIVQAN